VQSEATGEHTLRREIVRPPGRACSTRYAARSNACSESRIPETSHRCVCWSVWVCERPKLGTSSFVVSHVWSSSISCPVATTMDEVLK
jgi:hypothetical protein